MMTMTESQEPRRPVPSEHTGRQEEPLADPQVPKTKHTNPQHHTAPSQEPDKKKEAHEEADDGFTLDLRKVQTWLADDRVVMALFFLLSLAIHLLYQNASMYHFDSGFDILAVEETIANWKLTYSYGWGAPGMIVLVSIVHFFDTLITGTTSAEFAYNFVNILSASIAIPLVFILTKYLTKDRFISMLSALFFCVMPIWLSITTYPKTHAMTIVFGIAAVYLFLRSRDAENARNQALMLTASGTLTGLAVTIRPFSVFYMLPMAIIYLTSGLAIRSGKLVLDKRIINIKNVLLFFIPIFAIWYLLFFSRLDAAGGFEAFKAQLANEQREGWQGMFNAQTKVSFGYLTTTIGWVGWIAALLGVLYSFMKREKVLAIALFIWGASFFFYLGNLLPTEARFLTDSLVPLAIFMAMGVRLIYANQKYAGIAVAIFLIMVMFATIHPIIKDRAEYSGPRGFAEFVRDNTEPNAVIVSSDEYMFIRRYAGRETFYWIEGGVDRAAESLRNATPVYAIETSFAFPSPQDRLRMQELFDFLIIGEAKNEVYQFSELERRIFNEKLVKVTLKELPSPANDSKEMQDTSDEGNSSVGQEGRDDA